MLRHYRYFLWIIFLLSVQAGFSQAPERWNSAKIEEAIERLNFLGSALYVAAHPDDENTNMIAYLANEVKANTAYLSLTRGDGGQNLVGPEIRELLGLIRTQELLAARRLDGGKQFFTRANDFGYSKHPDETTAIWNKEEVLADVVYTFRKWRPDIVINRFDHNSAGRTHGHHTASATLALEAYELSGDPNAYPEQLEYVEAWQPKRHFFNTSWWFYGSQEAFAKADKSDMISMDLGVYYPAQGLSNNEIAAYSRSMHKSQGFGRPTSRGSNEEYAQLLKGEMPAVNDLFAGINTSWTRVKGGAPIGEILQSVQKNYRHEDPAASVPGLLDAYKLIEKLPDGYWKSVKMGEVKEVITACMGLFAEVSSADATASPGHPLFLNFELINRSPVKTNIERVEIQAVGLDTTLNVTLGNNLDLKWQGKVQLPNDIGYSDPYWLREEAELGMYKVQDQRLRGLPETPPALVARFELTIEGTKIVLERPVIYKSSDPVRGEFYEPFEILPPVAIQLKQPVMIFPDDAAQEVVVTVEANADGLAGSVKLEAPAGWKISPNAIPFELEQKGMQQSVSFQLSPPENQQEAELKAMALLNGTTYSKEKIVIDYDHIPKQTVLRPAKAKVVKLDLQVSGERVGYIMGAGDDIPASLEQIGFGVVLLEDDDLSKENLQQFDAVIAGVRAYNTRERLGFYREALMEYVKQGGTYIVQYNTNRGLIIPMQEIGPYPFQISRDRVTVEEAEIRILTPDHPILNFPNKITGKDFENWVQERGLYFPNNWSDQYTAILSSNDPGESPKDGGMLVAPYGEGWFIYTGYSWFRELPAGVPGAFRLFTNLIALGDHKQEK